VYVISAEISYTNSTPSITKNMYDNIYIWTLLVSKFLGIVFILKIMNYDPKTKMSRYPKVSPNDLKFRTNH